RSTEGPFVATGSSGTLRSDDASVLECHQRPMTGQRPRLPPVVQTNPAPVGKRQDDGRRCGHGPGASRSQDDINRGSRQSRRCPNRRRNLSTVVRARRRMPIAAIIVVAVVVAGSVAVWLHGRGSNGWTPALIRSSQLACYSGAANARDQSFCDCTIRHLEGMVNGTVWDR